MEANGSIKQPALGQREGPRMRTVGKGRGTAWIIIHLAFHPSKAFDKLPAGALNPRADCPASSSTAACPARHLKGARYSKGKSSAHCNKQPPLKCVEWGIKAEAHNITNCLWKSKLPCLQTLKHMYNRVLLLTLWLALLTYAGKFLQMHMLGMGECY